jgi:serine/threonine-protein kinase PRP4
VLQICDLGSAFRESDADNCPTPYLVSRFYRAPEVILGFKHTTAVDMWSVGACGSGRLAGAPCHVVTRVNHCVLWLGVAGTCLYELFTGTVMFPGEDNNDMLWKMMEVKGMFPKRLVKRHIQAFQDMQKEPHFDPASFRFRRHMIDPVRSLVAWLLGCLVAWVLGWLVGAVVVVGEEGG